MPIPAGRETGTDRRVPTGCCRSGRRALRRPRSADIMGNSAVLVVLALARSVRRRPRHNPSSRQGSAPNLDRRWTGEPMNRAGPSRPGELDAAGARPVDAGEPGETGEPADADARVSAHGDTRPRPPEGEAPRSEVPGGWLRRTAARSWVRHLVLLVVYLAAGIALTWPRTAYLWRHLLPETRDTSGYVWDLWWTAHQVAHLSQPLVHQPHGRPGRHPAGVRHHDAAGRPDHDTGHPGLRPQRLVRRADDPGARPDLLPDVPGGPAVAGRARGDRRRGPVRPVLDAGVAGLAAPEHRARHDVPADDAGGRGAAAPPARSPPGRDPGRGARREPAGQPGVGGDGRAAGSRRRSCHG